MCLPIFEMLVKIHGFRGCEMRFFLDGLMPVTGLPLPFLSYGGSALLSVFVALGLVGSVYIDSAKRFHF